MVPFCLKLTNLWHYIRTCTKSCIAICFRKTSVYRNGLYIRVCNSRNIVRVSLCLMPFWRRQIVLSRKVCHFVVAFMWWKLWSYLHSYLNSPRKRSVYPFPVAHILKPCHAEFKFVCVRACVCACVCVCVCVEKGAIFKLLFFVMLFFRIPS